MPYEGAFRIPMVMRWPARISPGAVTDHLVHLHDIAHTIIDVIGAEPLPFNDGVSLLPLLENPSPPDWRDQILQAFYGGEFLMIQRQVLTARYKYVFNGFDFDELYDLETDPHEMENAIANSSYKAIVADMQARLYELMAQMEDPLGDRPPARSGRERGSQWGAPRYLPRGKRL
jgi:arylsulfatase A-like enzyme